MTIYSRRDRNASVRAICGGVFAKLLCQYCGSGKHLTLDHVMPRSKGGSHTWDNVVAACERCNSRKGDCTLFEAGMQLRTKPKAPIHPTISFAEQFWIDMQGSLE